MLALHSTPASQWTHDHVRNATPEETAYMLRVLALANDANAPVDLAQQAVEEAERMEEETR